jgi:hypothetical protein
MFHSGEASCAALASTAISLLIICLFSKTRMGTFRSAGFHRHLAIDYFFFQKRALARCAALASTAISLLIICFFRKRASPCVALRGSEKVYTLREQIRRVTVPHHGVTHNMNHRKRWRYKSCTNYELILRQ